MSVHDAHYSLPCNIGVPGRGLCHCLSITVSNYRPDVMSTNVAISHSIFYLWQYPDIHFVMVINSSSSLVH